MLSTQTPAAQPEFGHSRLGQFYLDPDVLHLNHGSYGAVPRRVLETQQRLQVLAERQCSTFFREEYHRLAAENLAVAAGRFGGNACDWAFVENATSACNAIFLSQDLKDGDEVLFTSGIYGAVRKALTHWTAGRGVALSEIHLPAPIEAAEQVVDLIRSHLTDATRLLVLDHIVSTSGLLLPVAEIAAICRANGTRVLVDGAHAQGQIPLDIGALGVDYYTGNAHKWLFAPKGCGLVWVRPELQDMVHPTVISHGYTKGFQDEFNWIGTRDSSAWFAFGDAAQAHDDFGGPVLMDRNRALAAQAGAMVADALGGCLSGPPEMQSAMSTILIPGTHHKPDTELLQRDFNRKYRMETSFVPWEDRLAIRISAQVYNDLSDYEALIGALKDHFEPG